MNRTSARSTTRPRAASRSSSLIDLYFGRTGVEPGEPALRLAKLIDSLPNVALEGLQSYDGQAAHTTPFTARGARTNGNMAKAVETKALIEKRRHPLPDCHRRIDRHLSLRLRESRA